MNFHHLLIFPIFHFFYHTPALGKDFKVSVTCHSPSLEEEEGLLIHDLANTSAAKLLYFRGFHENIGYGEPFFINLLNQNVRTKVEYLNADKVEMVFQDEKNAFLNIWLESKNQMSLWFGTLQKVVFFNESKSVRLDPGVPRAGAVAVYFKTSYSQCFSYFTKCTYSGSLTDHWYNMWDAK